jgi:hypothetical protein
MVMREKTAGVRREIKLLSALLRHYIDWLPLANRHVGGERPAYNRAYNDMAVTGQPL